MPEPARIVHLDQLESIPGQAAEWAREDEDLEPLRDDPEFLALLSS